MAKVTKVKPKEGRPTDYNPEIANRICELISMSEKGIHKLYAENQDWMPVPSTIMLWLTKHPAFSEQYTLAKRLQMDLMGEKIIDIVDDSSGDVLITERGNIAENREFTSRSKLRAETRMLNWLQGRAWLRLFEPYRTFPLTPTPCGQSWNQLCLFRFRSWLNI